MAVQFIPTLMTGEKKIDEAFSIACGDFAGNVLFYKNGLLKEPVPVIAAGRMFGNRRMEKVLCTEQAGSVPASDFRRSSALPDDLRHDHHVHHHGRSQRRDSARLQTGRLVRLHDGRHPLRRLDGNLRSLAGTLLRSRGRCVRGNGQRLHQPADGSRYR